MSAISTTYPSKIIQVGKTIKYSTEKKKVPYSYLDIPTDPDGWIDSNKYLPKDYDLCALKLPECIKSGWYTGTIWDGLKIKELDTVLAWKRIKDG